MISQIGQDEWILEHHPSPGYFVDIGAYDGVTLSNTLRLERNGWKGVCVEPLPSAFNTLEQVRDCICGRVAIHNKTGEALNFLVSDMYSGISGYHPPKMELEVTDTISVATITLNDLLILVGAPKDITYISLDTEGNEIDILRAFDFNRWNVSYWTIEHNDHRYGNTRRSTELHRLMTSLGYKCHLVEQDIWCEKIDNTEAYLQTR